MQVVSIEFFKNFDFDKKRDKVIEKIVNGDTTIALLRDGVWQFRTRKLSKQNRQAIFALMKERKIPYKVFWDDSDPDYKRTLAGLF